MTRRAVRRDDALIERLRTRTLTWEDRQDEAAAGLLALARATDRVAPLDSGLPPVTRRSRRPAFAGVATTALAGLALAFSGLVSGGAAAPPPATKTDTAAVSQLLQQVTSDLEKADTASTTTRAALLAHAAVTLTTAEHRVAQLPSGRDRSDLGASSKRLQVELSHRRAAGPSATPRATGQPAATPSPAQPANPAATPRPSRSGHPPTTHGTPPPQRAAAEAQDGRPGQPRKAH